MKFTQIILLSCLLTSFQAYGESSQAQPARVMELSLKALDGGTVQLGIKNISGKAIYWYNGFESQDGSLVSDIFRILNKGQSAIYTGVQMEMPELKPSVFSRLEDSQMYVFSLHLPSYYRMFKSNQYEVKVRVALPFFYAPRTESSLDRSMIVDLTSEPIRIMIREPGKR